MHGILGLILKNSQVKKCTELNKFHNFFAPCFFADLHSAHLVDSTFFYCITATASSTSIDSKLILSVLLVSDRAKAI